MSIYRKRLDSLKAIMNDKGYNAFYIANITNVRYLSGFTGSSGFLLLTDEGDHFFSDGRYTEQSKHEVLDFKIHITTNHLKLINDNKLLMRYLVNLIAVQNPLTSVDDFLEDV